MAPFNPLSDLPLLIKRKVTLGIYPVHFSHILILHAAITIATLEKALSSSSRPFFHGSQVLRPPMP
jgi:hypothetical protein